MWFWPSLGRDRTSRHSSDLDRHHYSSQPERKTITTSANLLSLCNSRSISFSRRRAGGASHDVAVADPSTHWLCDNRSLAVKRRARARGQAYNRRPAATVAVTMPDQQKWKDAPPVNKAFALLVIVGLPLFLAWQCPGIFVGDDDTPRPPPS